MNSPNTNKMKILYITRHNPWGQGGGSVASKMYLCLFQHLFADKEIDLCISAQIKMNNIPTEIQKSSQINLIHIPPRSFISKILSIITGITHRYQNIGKKLIKSSNYSHIIFDHSSIAGSLIKYVPSTTKTITIHHNYEPAFYKDNTKSTLNKLIMLPIVKKLEQRAFQESNINLFLTKEDATYFKLMYGKHKGLNLITGLFEIDKTIKLRPVESLYRQHPTIIISGSLDNLQNYDGIKYFCHHLYPLIPPSFKIIITGKNPSKDIINLLKGKDNIQLIPNPKEMSKIVQLGNIYLSPAKAGGGIKVRVTDGLKLGLPIIAHETSARGYEAFIQRGYFKSFNSPQSFIKKLMEIQNELNTGRIKSEDILDLYKEQFSLNNAINLVNQYL